MAVSISVSGSSYFTKFFQNTKTPCCQRQGRLVYPQRSMAEAVVCASCPEIYHDRVAELCLQHQVQKAFGKAGDMVNGLSGKDWIPKWEAKVVMATVTKAQTLNSNKALILCIAGGKNCDAEMARQPALVKAIKTEMASQDFRVRVEWIEINEFLERYPEAKSKNSKSTKENVKPKDGKGGKDKKDSQGGKDGKDGKGGKDKKDSQGSKDGKDGKGGKDKKDGKGGKDGKDGKGGKDTKNGKGAVEGKGDLHSCYPKHSNPPVKESAKNAVSSQADKKFCKYWQQGECKNGKDCAFEHGPRMSSDPPKAKANAKKDKKDKKLPCTGCGRTFKDWQDMCSKHFLCKGHTPICVCQECGDAFKDDIACGQHQAAKGHKGMARYNDINDDEDESEGWDCGQCGKTFASESAVEQHQQSTGHGDFPSCLTCGRTFGFGDEQALLQHQMTKGHGGVQWLLNSDSEDEDLPHTGGPPMFFADHLSHRELAAMILGAPEPVIPRPW